MQAITVEQVFEATCRAFEGGDKLQTSNFKPQGNSKFQNPNSPVSKTSSKTFVALFSGVLDLFFCL